MARALARRPAGEEIVISGLAGKFPDSHNVYHFRDNLYNKIDMVTSDERRWEELHPEIPMRSGKLFDITKFDAGFFGTHWRQAQSLDPFTRLVLERVVECIIDAGFHPSELENTKTGVFIAACISETEQIWIFDRPMFHYYILTGCTRSMIPHRVSYFLKLNGPSMVIDAACSSSMFALQHGYDAIRSGVCQQAIVAGVNINLHPFLTLQFARLGVLNNDGHCKVFDEKADGYVRSEACCAVFLQKATDARRIYSEVVYAKSNCDGYKEQGITYPSGAMQLRLLREFYQDCDIDPTTLSFLEAHGTGTRVGDPEEMTAMDKIFCKGRTTPLLIGSIKSNIGHAEAPSGLCSITKAILAFQFGLIAPNMNYENPNQNIEALTAGRMRVVTEKTPLEADNDLIGVNSFGFGGANCHVLLKGNKKTKSNQGLPNDDLPRLVCVSGRVEDAITSILDDLKERKLDAEFVKLYHQIFCKDIAGHHHRGYSIISKCKGEIKRSQCFTQNLTKPLYLIFTDFGANWSKIIINQLSVLPLFSTAIQRINKILMTKGYNVTEAVIRSKGSVVDQAIANIAIQIGIVDVLKALEVNVDGYFGCGLGEFVCAYMDEALSLEAVMLSAYEIATSIKTPASSYLVHCDPEKVTEGDDVVATGRIYTVDNCDNEQVNMPLPLASEEGLPMRTKDIYKELRLRGYNYTGAFKKLKECDSSASTGLIHWEDNYTTFMDNMIQMKILQYDTRLLYVPTTIKKMSIDPRKHVALIQACGEEQNLPVYIYQDADVIKSGGIEIRGIKAFSIVKRKPRGEPVLEKYVFVPNFVYLIAAESVRVNMQLILENSPAIKVKVVEHVDDSTLEGSELLAPIVHAVLGDLPLVQPDVTVLTKQEIELPGINVKDKNLTGENDCHLVIGSNIFERVVIMHQCFSIIKESGFILSREVLDFDLNDAMLKEIDVLTYHTTDTEKLILFRKSSKAKPVTAINVEQEEFVWLEPLQKAVKNDSNVVAYAQSAPQSGVLGLVNCLRREPGGSNIRSVFIIGEAPQFDPTLPFYNEHLKKNFAVNVLKHGVWGTYRHLLLKNVTEVDTEHGFINVTVPGDLSSLRWIEGALKHDSVVLPEQVLVHVYVAALNFRDIMTASGRINADVATRDRLAQECIQGCEFAGRTSSHMASGKHTGKILIKLRNEEPEKLVLPKPTIRKVVPRYSCKHDKVYVIIGGLGGIGLELTDWLVLRGARKIVLTSRNGVKTGYQSLRIRTWQSYQVDVYVSMADVTTKEGCEEMLREASQYGEITAIFNLAVVLKDTLFENQTVETFQESFAPKVSVTRHLDALSRVLCQNLQDFVVFSSVSCGRGNAAQTNYGMANSIMERICEKRQADGFPALAVEWGAIADVGLVAEMTEDHTELAIGGTLQQKITSYLVVLDKLLKQKNAVVSSMVVAEKRSGSGGADNIVDAVANILGLDVKTISLHATLAELGMDSMTAVEIKQTLEREFEVFLTPQDIRSMTFNRLYKIQEEMESDSSLSTKKDRPVAGMKMFIRHMNSEKDMNVPFFTLKSKIQPHEAAPAVLIFPGIEGVAKSMESLTINTRLHHNCLQFSYDNPENTVPDMAKNLMPLVESLLNKNEPLNIIGYSFGAALALECVSMLESRGYMPGTLLLLDGAPEFLTQVITRNVNVNASAILETELLTQLMSLYMPFELIAKNQERLFKARDFEERLAIGDEILPKDTPHCRVYLKRFATALLERIKSMSNYKPDFVKIKSTVKLFKPSRASLLNIDEDYKLSELTVKPVSHMTFQGNHATILNNLQMAKSVDRIFGIEAAEDGETTETQEKEEANESGIQENETVQGKLDKEHIFKMKPLEIEIKQI